uniref:Strictosidine synthase conserved region domain-containing protein n=1 Tax=Oryza glumipatula TaxID=40148 RepID=A0A0E0AC11_9ORYZ
MRSTARQAATAAAFALIVFLVLLSPSPTAAATATTRMFKTIDARRSQHLDLGGSLVGPESVGFDGKGRGPYSGVSDGRIMRWNGEAAGWSTYTYSPSYTKNKCAASTLPTVQTESKCGRPLGLRCHYKTGNLYIADAYMGLMRVGPKGGEATVLATKADGVPLRFTNGVDIDQQHELPTISARASHGDQGFDRTAHEVDPRTNQVTVLQSNITYPNGVAISADRTHLIVALTGPCKLMRHWIRGPKTGKSEPFADLPGYPDGKGGYWIALHREKYELPFGPDSHLVAMRVSAGGKLVQQMRGPKSLRPTEVMERKDGKIYMGNVELPYVGVVKSS